MENIQKMIKESNELFDAIQTAGNEARRQVGFNIPYEFANGLISNYETYDQGPEQLSYGQYSYLNDQALGKTVNPSEVELTGEKLFWWMEKVYKRITIKTTEEPVCRIEGYNAFEMSLYIQGPWEEKLMEWFRTDGRQLR